MTCGCLPVFCIVLHRSGSLSFAFVFVVVFVASSSVFSLQSSVFGLRRPLPVFTDAFRRSWALCALNKLTIQLREAQARP